LGASVAASVKDAAAPAGRGNAMSSDLRHALRGLIRAPGFSAVVILILGVGIGAVTVMFAALWNVVLRPLPFPESERLVWVQAITDAGRPNSLSAPDYFDYREGCRSLASTATQLVFQPGAVVTGRGEPERVTTTVVSGSLFETLGVSPALGRSFRPDEEVAGGPHVMIISHSFRQRRFGGDPSVLGTALNVDGVSTEIVAVMPESFDYPTGVDVWLPMRRDEGWAAGRGNNNFFMIGRLADAATREQAQAQLNLVAARISQSFPGVKGGWSVAVESLHEHFFGNLRPLMLTLMAATALLLLLTIANLASLFLAKNLAREHELAVRLSIGASPWHVTRHVLVQSLFLSAIGAVLGIGLALLGVRALITFGPADLPRLSSIAIDGRVLLVTVAATILTGLALAVAPALRSGRVAPLSALREGGHTTQGGRGLKLRGALVATQVALSFVLLVGFALFLRSAWRLQAVDPGFDPDGLLTVDVQLPQEPEDARPGSGGPIAEMIDRIRGLSGVVSAAGVDELPGFGGPYNGVHRGDRSPQVASDLTPATRRFVTEDYFRTMRISMLAGRSFERTDGPDSRPVTVVSKALADRLFPNEDPLEKIMVLPWGEGIRLAIVGVASDVRDFGPAVDIRPAFYLSFRQIPFTLGSLRLAVRASGDPMALVPAIRTTVRGVDKDAPLFAIGTMKGWLAQSTARSRLTAVLLCVFASIALVLSAMGLYGVTAAFVATRSRDIGIRAALGARPHQAMARVFASAALMAGTGLVAGLAGSLAAARMVRGMLFQIEPTEPVVLLTVLAVLTLAVTAACAVPAWRAARIDPAVTLRCE
jgi:putative ABC transport system permease protein